MNDFINHFFGTGTELTALQMSVRALFFFFVTLVYLRIAGIRTLGKKSSMDMVIVIVLGSVIARGIAGASGIAPTLASSFVLVIVHRIISWFTVVNQPFEKIIKADKIVLYKDGIFMEKNMRREGISMHDFYEGLRLDGKNMEEVKIAYLETNGELSFVENSKQEIINKK